MKLLNILILLLACCLLFGCNKADTSEQTAKKPPVFIKTDDPKVFLHNYLKDLAGDRYMPKELYERLRDKAQLPRTIELIEQHDTMAFLHWYYLKSFLAQVQVKVDKVLADMDYRLKVMDVTKKDAAKVVLLVESGVVRQKAQLLAGKLSEHWKKLDDNRYEVLLKRGDWTGKVGIAREDGRWKLLILRVHPDEK